MYIGCSTRNPPARNIATHLHIYKEGMVPRDWLEGSPAPPSLHYIINHELFIAWAFISHSFNTETRALMRGLRKSPLSPVLTWPSLGNWRPLTVYPDSKPNHDLSPTLMYLFFSGAPYTCNHLIHSPTSQWPLGSRNWQTGLENYLKITGLYSTSSGSI